MEREEEKFAAKIIGRFRGIAGAAKVAAIRPARMLEAGCSRMKKRRSGECSDALVH
jgi:hypothetical protein